jgi:hypothetical protein
MFGMHNLYLTQKKGAARIVSNSSMPLRHIEVIVIWEGNYNPDNKNIGYYQVKLKNNFLLILLVFLLLPLRSPRLCASARGILR